MTRTVSFAPSILFDTDDPIGLLVCQVTTPGHDWGITFATDSCDQCIDAIQKRTP